MIVNDGCFLRFCCLWTQSALANLFTLDGLSRLLTDYTQCENEEKDGNETIASHYIFLIIFIRRRAFVGQSKIARGIRRILMIGFDDAL